jgi:hypothetical protein
MNASAASVLAASILVSLPAAARAASPCEAPEQYVRASKLAVVTDAPAPLLRPYVIGGIAAVAVREDTGQRWLELAVHSVDDARRQLADRAASADGTVALAAWRDRVWLRCPAAPRT